MKKQTKYKPSTPAFIKVWEIGSTELQGLFLAKKVKLSKSALSNKLSPYKSPKFTDSEKLILAEIETEYVNYKRMKFNQYKLLKLKKMIERDEYENNYAGEIECHFCHNFFDEELSSEISDNVCCPDCLPKETLVSKLKQDGLLVMVIEKFKNYIGIYRAPIELNNLVKVNPSKYGVSANEFLDLLREESSEPINSNLFEMEVFDIEIKY